MRYLKYLILTIALCLPSMAQMGEHRKIFGGSTTLAINSAKCTHTFTGSASFGCTFTLNLTSGNIFFTFCTNWSSAALATPTIGDTQGNTFTPVGAGTSGLDTGNSNSQMWAWSAIASSSGADTFTCNFQAGHEGNYEVDGLEFHLTTVNTSNFNHVGNAIANNSPSITSTQTATWLLYCVEPTTDSSMNIPTAGYTIEIPIGTGSTLTSEAADKASIPAGTGSATCNRNTPGSPIHAVLIAVK